MNTWMWFICLWILVICGQSGRSSRPPVAKLQVIISSSRGRIAPEGCKVRFRCVANSTDGRVNAYNWLVNGSRISATDKYHINYYYKHKKLIRYSTLIVVNVSRHIDEGFYSCIAITRLGSAISNQALLQVAYFDVLENSSSTFFLIKSLQSITLHPPSARIFPTRRVTWFDQNRNIIKDGYSQSYISSDGSLNIIGVRNVTEEYRCIVENVVTGENYVMYYKISVQGKLKWHNMTIMKSSPNQTVTAGTSLVAIECIVSLAIYNFTASPSTVTWYKDNVRLTEIGTSSKYSYINNNTTMTMKLFIHRLEIDDSGVYTCKHETANQTLVCKALLLVKQKVSQPSCNKELSPILLANSGEHKELQCPDDGEEDVVCLWYKNAIPIAHLNNSHVYEDDGDLVFDKISLQDTGLYQVMLKNDAGQCMIRFPTYVRVKGVKSSTSVVPSSTSFWMSIKSSIICTPHIATPTTSVISWPTTSLSSPRTIDSTTAHSSPSRTSTSTYLATPIPTSYTPTPIPTSYTPTPIPTSLISTPIPTSYTPTPIPTSLISTPIPASYTPTPITTSYTPTPIPTSLISTPIPTSLISTPIPTSTSTYLQTSTTSQTTDEPGIEGTTGASDRVTIDTTQSASTKNQENKSDDLLMWIASGSGGFVVLTTVVIATICCSCKRKRRRKGKFDKNADLFEEMEMTFNKRSGKQAVDHSGIQGSPARGVDTKRLLNDDESLYAPVLALDNAALNFEDTFLLQNPLVNRNSAHMYDEPIKVQRKPYNKPLPTLPRAEDLQKRRSSSHSYLELLGPNENLNVLTDKPKSVPEENLYDCARDGVLTDTLRRIKNQHQQQQPLYHVLEKTDNTCANRESTLYASAEDLLPEPVYHVLEPSRPESMYQALVEYAPNHIEQPLDDSIYQPLDKKARSTSAPSSTLLASKMKSKRTSSSGHMMKSDEQYSRSYPEYKDDNAGCYVYSDDLYQPLNNTERCPLNVSKPKNSTLPFASHVRKGSLPLVEGEEPTLHAIDVSPRGSLKQNEKQTKKPGHRRNLSDTHTIVNISRLTQRRASAGDGLGLGCNVPFPGRTKRFHSDAGLCPIDLSLLRVSIDFESEMNLGKPSNDASERNSGETIYMPLVKSRDSNENQEIVNSVNSVKT